MLNIVKTHYNGLMLVLETSEKTRVLSLSENEMKNLFFFMCKHNTNLFEELKDSDLKSKIIEFLVKSEVKLEE